MRPAMGFFILLFQRQIHLRKRVMTFQINYISGDFQIQIFDNLFMFVFSFSALIFHQPALWSSFKFHQPTWSKWSAWMGKSNWRTCLISPESLFSFLTHRWDFMDTSPSFFPSRSSINLQESWKGRNTRPHCFPNNHVAGIQATHTRVGACCTRAITLAMRALRRPLSGFSRGFSSVIVSSRNRELLEIISGRRTAISTNSDIPWKNCLTKTAELYRLVNILCIYFRDRVGTSRLSFNILPTPSGENNIGDYPDSRSFSR